MVKTSFYATTQAVELNERREHRLGQPKVSRAPPGPNSPSAQRTLLGRPKQDQRGTRLISPRNSAEGPIGRTLRSTLETALKTPALLKSSPLPPMKGWAHYSK
jgi:hypothetical protein